jgi:hypothetical protein
LQLGPLLGRVYNELSTSPPTISSARYLF